VGISALVKGWIRKEPTPPPMIRQHKYPPDPMMHLCQLHPDVPPPIRPMAMEEKRRSTLAETDAAENGMPGYDSGQAAQLQQTPNDEREFNFDIIGVLGFAMLLIGLGISKGGLSMWPGSRRCRK